VKAARHDSEGPRAGSVRLNRYLALAGLGTRRTTERLLASGRVAVAGRTERDPGARVAPGDEVTLDGSPLVPRGSAGVLVRLDHRGRIPPLAHPAALHPAGTNQDAGVAVLLSDEGLAGRLRRSGYDPGRLAGVGAAAEFRPLSPAELDAAAVFARRGGRS
jgi:S4 domain